MGKSASEVSFIIPTLNEAKNITYAIDSIKEALGDHPHEIIVSDNGSSDKTREIAKSKGARVLLDRKASIARLRNLGSQEARSLILVFIDADVRLANDWYERLSVHISDWSTDELIVTGSRCLSPHSDTFIDKNWFIRLHSAKSSYINSGHLITTKSMYNKIGGFNEKLKTSEDVDFCTRAMNNGGVIKEEASLVAYHHGYPTTIIDFIIREAWHGREDMSTIKKYLHSKTALAATVNSVIILFAIILYLFSQNLLLTILPLIMSILLCQILTHLKFGASNITQNFKTSLCFELYLAGRALSVFLKVTRPRARSQKI